MFGVSFVFIQECPIEDVNFYTKVPGNSSHAHYWPVPTIFSMFKALS